MLIQSGFLLLYISTQLTTFPFPSFNLEISQSLYIYISIFLILFKSSLKLKYSSKRNIKLLILSIITLLPLYPLYITYNKLEDLHKYTDIIVMFFVILFYFLFYSPSCASSKDEFESSLYISNIFNFIYKYVLIHMMYVLFSLQSEYQYNVTKIKKIDYKGLISEVFKQSSIIFGCESVCEFLKNNKDEDEDEDKQSKSTKNKIVHNIKHRLFYFGVVLICKIIYLILNNKDLCGIITSKINEMFMQPHNIIISNMFGNNKETKFKVFASLIVFFLK